MTIHLRVYLCRRARYVGKVDAHFLELVTIISREHKNQIRCWYFGSAVRDSIADRHLSQHNSVKDTSGRNSTTFDVCSRLHRRLVVV